MIKCHVCKKKNMVYIHLLKFEGLDRRLWIQGKSCLFSKTNSFALKKKPKKKKRKKNEKKNCPLMYSTCRLPSI